MATFAERMLGAARLQTSTYEEIESDTTATGQALGVVVLVGIATAIGTRSGVAGLVVVTLAGVLSWLLWAWLTYIIGTRWLAEPGTRADAGQLLRTIGFASTPGLLRILGVVPVLQGIVFLGTAVWTLVAVIIAVRQALDYTATWRAVVVCLLGWIIQVIAFAIVIGFLGTPPAA